MKAKHILILGGYGSTGFPIAQYLLSQTDVSLTLAGRSLEKAEGAAAKLNGEQRQNRVKALRADASDPQSLRRVFEGADMVVVASSTSEYVESIARCALETGIDYLDVQFSTTKMHILQSLSSEIERADLCFITDGGFHPGLPAAMVRFAADQIDSLESANVGSVIMIGLKLFPKTGLRPLGRLMFWGLKTFSRPPYGTLLKLEARGKKDTDVKTVEMVIAHESGYALTAIPVVACLMQYLDGSIRKPGLWFQAHIVESKRFFKDMEKMGAQVKMMMKLANL